MFINTLYFFRYLCVYSRVQPMNLFHRYNNYFFNCIYCNHWYNKVSL